MSRFLALAGAVGLLMGTMPAAPVAAAPPLIETKVVDECYDNCVLICWKMTGDWGACEIACMDTLCFAGSAPTRTQVQKVIRQDYAREI